MKDLKNSQTLKRKDFLTLLSKAKSAAKRKFVIDNCSSYDLNAITESCKNLLANNIKLSKKQFQSLKKHKSDIRKIARKDLKPESKKQILKQRGGFLSLLLPLAVEAIKAIVKHKKKKK